MKINKEHCFFEQSGTFKNEFIKLGIPAEDYDIQNEFGQTDHVIDLFDEINKAYFGKGSSVFDNITHDDLIMAFFPCIYFTGFSNPLYFSGKDKNMQKLPVKERTDKILQRADARNKFYKFLYKLVAVCEMRGLRMIFENPWNTNGGQHYLKNNFLKEPTIVDVDRTRRGDCFVKPTGYWFFNCTNTFGRSFQKPKERKKLCSLSGLKGGLNNPERSMISHDYARNFICDFIIGKQQIITQTTLFNQ